MRVALSRSLAEIVHPAALVCPPPPNDAQSDATSILVFDRADTLNRFLLS